MITSEKQLDIKKEMPVYTLGDLFIQHRRIQFHLTFSDVHSCFLSVYSNISLSAMHTCICVNSYLYFWEFIPTCVNSYLYLWELILVSLRIHTCIFENSYMHLWELIHASLWTHTCICVNAYLYLYKFISLSWWICTHLNNQRRSSL